MRDIDAQPTVAVRQATLAIASTATTVVAVAAADTALHAPALITTLAELATRHELVIVYGYAKPPDGSLPPHRLIAAMRAVLPRQMIVAMLLDAAAPAAPPERKLLADLLNDGAVAVAVVEVADPSATALALAGILDADLALRLVPDQAQALRFEPLDSG